MKVSKVFLISTLLLSSLPALAHDEGHGPKVTDSGKFGGLISAVVEKKEANLGPKAKLQYKAELVRASDGKVQVYLYDSEMKPVDSSAWNKKASASVFAHKKGSKAQAFDLSFDGKAFVGQLPAALTKPYNLDFTFSEKGRDLLSAFDNLD